MDSSKLEPSRLKEAYKIALAAAWTESRAKHPDQTPYAFVVYGIDGCSVPHLGPHVLTEESLTEVAQDYIERGYHDELDEARDALRYSPGDSPHFGEVVDHVRAVDELMEPHHDWLWENGGFDIPVEAVLQALYELDELQLFGSGANRERILLVVIGDGMQEYAKLSANRLNPKNTAGKYHEWAKIEGEFASSDSIAVGFDGQSIYSIGSRNGPDIVAYDLNDNIPSRRGSHPFLELSDACREVVCTDNGLLFAWKESSCPIDRPLTIFRANNCDRVQDPVDVRGGRRFAVSRDGSRIAITTQDGTIEVFDSDFRLLWQCALDQKVRRLLLLQNGELLVLTETALMSVGSQGSNLAAAIPDTGFFISVDASEMQLALSELENDDPVEIGVRLYHLPSRKALRTFIVPGYQAIEGTLSPNGQLLAVKANQIGTARKRLVVFDTATGQEIGRRRSDLLTNQIAFLQDNRTLAIGVSEFTTSEPIHFWKILDS